MANPSTSSGPLTEATSSGPSSEARRRPPEIPAWRRKLWPYLLSVPAVLIIIGILYPFVLGAIYSFLNYAAVNPNPKFVGLRNFGSVLTDPTFWAACS